MSEPVPTPALGSSSAFPTPSTDPSKVEEAFLLNDLGGCPTNQNGGKVGELPQGCQLPPPSAAMATGASPATLTDSTTLQGDGDDGLQRKLQSQHMQMIAIGGNIGTGLFMGSGNALYNGGPAAVLIGYLYIACMLYFVTAALAEMATVFPVSGSFVTYASRFIEPAWGFALGWNYLFQWLIALPIQLTVVTILISGWDHGAVSPGVWIALFLVLISLMNLLGIEKYGRAEVLLSMTKIVAIVLFIILAFAIDMGAGDGNHYRGSQTWSAGAFRNGFKGICNTLITGAFAFAGAEIIGLTAAESENPRKEVPKATKQVFWTIACCNILSVFFIGLIVPSTDPRLAGEAGTATSPFVLALQMGGLKGLPHVYNAIILLSVFSVAISSVYAASRTLVALAERAQAPRVCGRIDSRGRPLVAIGISLAFGMLGFAQYASDAEAVFRWLLALAGLAIIFTWVTIAFAHLRYRRAWKLQGHELEELPFRSPTGEWGSMVAIGMNVVVLVFHFYAAASPIDDSGDGKQRAMAFFQAYLAAPVVLLFYIGGKIMIPGSTLVPLADMDLQTGRRLIQLEDLVTESPAGGAARQHGRSRLFLRRDKS